MRFYDQATPTSCVRACLASLLDLPLAGVPDLMAPRDGRGWARVRAWLQARGRKLIDVPDARGCGFVLLRGVSPRGTRHCVIGRDDGIGVYVVHDPHPSRAGLVKIDRISDLV